MPKKNPKDTTPTYRQNKHKRQGNRISISSARKTNSCFSETWQKTKLKLLGHIMRCSEEDPIRQVVLEPGGWEPKQELKRRVGKPRQNWLEHSLQVAFEQILQNEWVE